MVAVSKASKTKIFFNKKQIRFPTVRSVVQTLTEEPAHIAISSKLPLGCGFGLSGASALATAYAVNELFRLNKAKMELAIIAHTAEVENKTGLGDVVNQYYGGFLLKQKPSSQFVVEKLAVGSIPIYCRSFSRIATRTILSQAPLTRRINKAADVALKSIEKAKTVRDIIAIAKTFALDSGLLQHTKTRKTIEQIEKRGGLASMIILGNAVFSDIPFQGSFKLTITDKGAHLL